MEIKIPIHSVIDVITNSSTEIFTFAKNNAVELCHEAINEILKVSRSEKKSEELFDVYIEPDSGYLIDCLFDILEEMNDDNIADGGEGDEVYLKYEKRIKETESIKNYSDRIDKESELIKEIYKYLIETDKVEDYIDIGNIQTYVRIESKDKTISTKDIYGIFDSATYEEERDC
jgi:hypothetical protein